MRLSPFSTMSALRGAAAAPAGKREYDSEIKDIASYVHNRKMDSELAVSDLPMTVTKLTLDSMILLVTFCWTHLGVGLKLYGSRNVRSYLVLPCLGQLFLMAHEFPGRRTS